MRQCDRVTGHRAPFDRSIARVALAACLVAAYGCGVREARRVETVGAMKTLTGTIDVRGGTTLPPDVVVDVQLAQLADEDATPVAVSEIVFRPTRPLPIPFSLEYVPESIDDRAMYTLRATIRSGDQVLFVTDTPAMVLTRGGGRSADLELVSGGGGAAAAPLDLAGRRWMLRALAGEEIRPTEGGRPPFLQFEGTPPQLSAYGQGGCNTFRGNAQVDGSQLEFGALASTKMACPDLELESRFFTALSTTATWKIHGTWLLLGGAEGEVARFEAATD